MKKIYAVILGVILLTIIDIFCTLNIKKESSSFKSYSERYYCKDNNFKHSNNKNNKCVLSSKTNKDKMKKCALVLKTNEGKKIVEKVRDKYIKDSNVDKNNIMSIEVRSNIKYEGYEKEELEEESIDSMAEQIIEENHDNSIVKVDFECKEVRFEDIPPKVKEIDTNDLYIGERQKEEGTKGIKEIIAKAKYTNGVKVDEEILEENTLIKQKDTIIRVGRKNPINDGVPFLIHPTNGGIITSRFGNRWGRNHNGIDIGHKEGDNVYSAFDGIVKECRYDSGYGNKIIVKHENNIETVYAHLSKFDINKGDVVKAGDLIGRVGTTGKSTGPHLHFEVRINGVPVNPETFIKA